jgi:hypothetical protein
MTDRVAGMLRDKTRPSRIPPLEPEVAARVVAATQANLPGETTHWTATAMAKIRIPPPKAALRDERGGL